MTGTADSLLAAFKQTEHQLSGHGKRNAQIMKDALEGLDGLTESDMYGKGEVIEAFQRKMASYLGKRHAVFFPSGTMAQQAAMRIWSDRRGSRQVAYHPLCHMEIHEEDGLRLLHGIEPVLLAEPDRLIGLEDVLGMDPGIACLLLELPQREIGGQLPDYRTLEAISAYCREKGIKLHLDGARLFEVLPYYKKTAAEVAALFDSAYISFYKGIGGIAGAILAADDPEFIREAALWKRRHGGDLISLYPYIASADYYFDMRINRMGQYYQEAQELAAMFNSCHPAVRTLPSVPVSNMFHVHFSAAMDKMERILSGIHLTTGIGFTGRLRDINGSSCSFEIGTGDQYGLIPKEKLHQAFQMLAAGLWGASE